jgi:hypothetical protein
MNAVAVLDAERIKLSTTRSPMWIAITIAVMSLVLAAVEGNATYGLVPLEPEQAALGVAVFGVPVLMVLASMTVTAEYRSGMIRTTFIATPNRTLVLLAKVVVASVFSAVLTAVLVVASALVAGLPLGSPGLLHATWAIALYAALAATLGVAVGALVRAGPGAVAVLLLWPLVAEPTVGNLPDTGSAAGPLLPFNNIFLFTRVPSLYPAYEMPWGPLGSLAYFVAFVVVVLGAAVVVVNVRDA